LWTTNESSQKTPKGRRSIEENLKGGVKKKIRSPMLYPINGGQFFFGRKKCVNVGVGRGPPRTDYTKSHKGSRGNQREGHETNGQPIKQVESTGGVVGIEGKENSQKVWWMSATTARTIQHS